ncbi:MAG: N-acetylmuramoyl-L-alanine amidase [Defluviitaleaceae bacterium]|nr:N-acetylmuramoyl-L-alanine amidase [Defluviitaleaceae bacterium]
MKKILQATIFCVILVSLVGIQQVSAAMPVYKKVIMIDAGHGDWDPGKQSRGVDEKDINLAISEQLQMLFELGGAVVFTTRSGDTSLANRKRGDLTARANEANELGADIFISIHQNSFQSEAVYGAQVFYHNTGDQSKVLAESIQARFNTFIGRRDGTPHTRLARAADSYFVLKKTTMPAVIVECGFMSNAQDLKLLQDENFQARVVWAIYMGVMDYFGMDDAAEPEIGAGIK